QGIDAGALLLCFYGAFSLMLVGSRLVGTYLQGLLEKHFRIRKTVAIIGKNEGGRNLAHYFRAHERNYRFEGYLTERDDQLLSDSGKITDAANNQLLRAVAQDIQEVYVSLPPYRIAQAAALVEAGERHCLRVKLVPDLTRQD